MIPFIYYPNAFKSIWLIDNAQTAIRRRNQLIRQENTVVRFFIFAKKKSPSTICFSINDWACLHTPQLHLWCPISYVAHICTYVWSPLWTNRRCCSEYTSSVKSTAPPPRMIDLATDDWLVAGQISRPYSHWRACIYDVCNVNAFVLIPLAYIAHIVNVKDEGRAIKNIYHRHEKITRCAIRSYSYFSSLINMMMRFLW